ncbi:enoyl-CoA hydratase/isomerase-like protein [Streptomyces sp. CEV 2-1]|nr:enoyl-CoA hydratase/isomerase-like protein [Streptomyces sp. CEV 2-1]
MQSQPVEYREITPSIVQITMQDTVHKNTFSDELITGLQDAFARVGANERCKAVVLTGYGNYFASGGTKESLLLIQERRISFTDADIYGLGGARALRAHPRPHQRDQVDHRARARRGGGSGGRGHAPADAGAEAAPDPQPGRSTRRRSGSCSGGFSGCRRLSP